MPSILYTIPKQRPSWQAGVISGRGDGPAQEHGGSVRRTGRSTGRGWTRTDSSGRSLERGHGARLHPGRFGPGWSLYLVVMSSPSWNLPPWREGGSVQPAGWHGTRAESYCSRRRSKRTSSDPVHLSSDAPGIRLLASQPSSRGLLLHQPAGPGDVSLGGGPL